MYFFKEIFLFYLLMFAFAAQRTEMRTKRNINEQMIGGVKPSNPVRTVVAIMYLDPVTGHKVPRCSGTVIENMWVVTAGHCFPDDSLANITIVAGEMDLGAYYGGYSTRARTIQPKNVYKPENYLRIPKKVLDNDLALVELVESLEVSKNAFIEAAALPPPGMKMIGEEFQVVGWGKTGKFSDRSPALLSIQITINQDNECRRTHGENKYFPHRMFCGGMKNKTTCNGDSGGGAIFHGWDVPVILGVVSFGKDNDIEKCKSSTVYTKISAFLPWIFELTKIKPLEVFASVENYRMYQDNLAANDKYCQNYLDYVADESSILYLSESKQVWLPSLLPVQGCSVPPYPIPSLYGAVSAIVNNKLTICGGWDGSNTISKCYSLDHGKWWLQQPIITERYDAGASLSPAGIIITGGDVASGPRLSSTEVLTGDGWVAGPDMLVAVSFHCQVTVGSRVYVTGGRTDSGRSTAVYALDDQTWTKIADMKYGREGHSCAALDNNLFLIGGHENYKSVEIYNMVEKTWNHKAAALTSNLYFGHALVHDGHLYLVHTDGEVERIAADMSEWEVVGNVGFWGVRGISPFNPAAIVTREMLNC